MAKMGRPKCERPKDVKYSVRFDEEMEKKLIEYCLKNKMTKGEVIRKALKEMWEKREKE